MSFHLISAVSLYKKISQSQFVTQFEIRNYVPWLKFNHLGCIPLNTFYNILYRYHFWCFKVTTKIKGTVTLSCIKSYWRHICPHSGRTWTIMLVSDIFLILYWWLSGCLLWLCVYLFAEMLHVCMSNWFLGISTMQRPDFT